MKRLRSELIAFSIGALCIRPRKYVRIRDNSRAYGLGFSTSIFNFLLGWQLQLFGNAFWALIAGNFYGRLELHGEATC